MKKNILICFVVFIALILDLQLNFFLTFFFTGTFKPNCHLFLLILVSIAASEYDSKKLYSFLVVGALYDIYVLNILGMAMILFPLFNLLIGSVFKVNRLTIWNLSLLMFIFIFLFESGHFLTSILLRTVSYSGEYFIIRILVPTFILNLIMAILLYPVLKAIMKMNRHLIVTNM